MKPKNKRKDFHLTLHGIGAIIWILSNKTKGEKKETWLVLGAAAVLSAIFHVIWTLRHKDAKRFRFLSLAFTALTLCAFYADGAGRVIREDWAGLMDTMPAINTVLWVCTGASILINAISQFQEKK